MCFACCLIYYLGIVNHMFMLLANIEGDCSCAFQWLLANQGPTPAFAIGRSYAADISSEPRSFL